MIHAIFWITGIGAHRHFGGFLHQEHRHDDRLIDMVSGR